MSNPKSLASILTTVTGLFLACLLAVPLLLGGSSCDTIGTTGATSNSISLMTWNLCSKSCPGYNTRAKLAGEEVSQYRPDILTVQEGGWSTKYRRPTFKAMGALGYKNANGKSPFLGRYVFYDPAKFSVVKSDSYSLGGTHGLAWALLKTKADGQEFVVADVHLKEGKSAAADAERARQMEVAIPRVEKVAAGRPIIWPGDYNSNKSRATDAPAAAMNAAGYSDSVAIAASKTKSTVNSAKDRSATAKVKRDGNLTDHVYVSPGVQVGSCHEIVEAKNGRYLAPFITDHNPLLVLFGLPVATSDAPAKAAVISDATWSSAQRSNARAIVDEGTKLGVPVRGQVIAVMTALTESSLIVVDHGDAAGPDSRGLFQQRDSWGTLAQRMDPAASAGLFFKVLQQVLDWQELAPTVAAHRVQRNADPNAYAKNWTPAKDLVASLTGSSDLDLAAASSCSDGTTDAAWSSGNACDFGISVSNPDSCADALRRAAQIAKDAPCADARDGGTWRRRCLEFVGRAYGYTYAGSATAIAHWDLLKSKGLVHAGDTRPPPGALVFWGPTASNSAGHVALYAGDGRAFSNDFIRSGCIDLTPMSTISRAGTYLGWAPPVFPNGG